MLIRSPISDIDYGVVIAFLEWSVFFLPPKGSLMDYHGKRSKKRQEFLPFICQAILVLDSVYFFFGHSHGILIHPY